MGLIQRHWDNPTGFHLTPGQACDIENCFARRKQYRTTVTRYDKRAVNFLGAIYLAASGIWLN